MLRHLSPKSEGDQKTYGLRWFAKALPLAGLGAFVVYCVTAPWTTEVKATTLLMGAAILIFFLATAVHFFVYRVILTDDEILVRRLIWDKTLQYEEVATLDFSNPIHLLQLHHPSEFWPALTVFGGIEHKRELAAKIVAKVPEDAEVIDPYGRLDQLMGKEL